MGSLKEHFLLDRGVVFLNHGSFGATPRSVFEAYQRWQRELERQPVEFLGRRHDGLMAQARAALGRYFSTEPGNLVYTQNVTISVNIVARSLELGPGDEVLASDHEYGACDRTWRFLSRERGFRYINQGIPMGIASRSDLVDRFWRGVGPRTKLMFFSHITSPTALMFPVEQICRRARAEGILTLVDGAHAPGQIQLDLPLLGADFYGGNLHKWLCAPKGAGFLYARPEVQALLKPLVVSWGYESEKPSGSTFVDYHEWWGTRDIAAFLAVEDAIRFQAEHDWPEVRAECHEMLQRALGGIAQITGLPPQYADDSWYVQMGVAALPPKTNIETVKARLYADHGIEVPIIDWHGQKMIRVSVQAYNEAEDIDRLLKALPQAL